MRLFALEHSKLAYRVDFALYGTAPVALAGFLMIAGPHGQRLVDVAPAVIGLASWTLVEYGLHRFVLHGLQPFSAWHAEHHSRPTALIFAPTILSATLVAVMVFLLTLMLGDVWRACALTLGVLTGYLGYAITHHALHHWSAGAAWILRRKRWHALHHGRAGQPGHYGVTTTFWDHVFGTGRC